MIDGAVTTAQAVAGTSRLAGAGPGEVGAALAAVREALVPHLTARGVELGAAAWLVTAARPVACPLS